MTPDELAKKTIEEIAERNGCVHLNGFGEILRVIREAQADQKEKDARIAEGFPDYQEKGPVQNVYVPRGSVIAESIRRQDGEGK